MEKNDPIPKHYDFLTDDMIDTSLPPHVKNKRLKEFMDEKKEDQFKKVDQILEYVDNDYDAAKALLIDEKKGNGIQFRNNPAVKKKTVLLLGKDFKTLVQEVK